jgi:hypothetical protein
VNNPKLEALLKLMNDRRIALEKATARLAASNDRLFRFLSSAAVVALLVGCGPSSTPRETPEPTPIVDPWFPTCIGGECGAGGEGGAGGAP